jgi:hypothetical protein
MRTCCLECILKHLGQATVLMHEAVKGYPFYYVYVIGHLCEAEDEAAEEYPLIMQKILTLRRDYQAGVAVDIDKLVSEIFEIKERNDGKEIE